MSKTSVVNVRSARYDVYIGRAGSCPDPRVLGSDGRYGNPYSIGKDGGRERVIELYRTYFYDRLRCDQKFAAEIASLKGKILGCHCYPKPCHGSVIADYLEDRQ